MLGIVACDTMTGSRVFFFFVFLTRSVEWPRLTVSCLGLLFARIIDPYHPPGLKGRRCSNLLIA